MKRLILVAAALSLGACTNSARNACNRAKACCATMSVCEEINREGLGWEERCEIESNASIQELGTYRNELCNRVASATQTYLDCLGGVSCADISDSPVKGHVAKCDPQAVAVCNALRASGDACGHDWADIKCDSWVASLDLL